MIDRVTSWWFAPIPWRRLLALSWIAHAMVLYTVFWNDRWAANHAGAPRSFYQPILLGRVLHLPAPTPLTMALLQVVIVAAVLVAVFVRPSRWANAAVASSYTLWLTWAFSFSKVDHDRLTIVVVLWILAVVPGRAAEGDDACGWAVRTIQFVFIVAYPLSAISKIRKSGWSWASQATFSRAIIRRGTMFGDLLVSHRTTLVIGQWLFIAFEFAAVSALWLKGRGQRIVLWGVFGLHFFTWIAISIHFLPHSIFLLSFVPLERLWRDGADEMAEASPSLAQRLLPSGR